MTDTQTTPQPGPTPMSSIPRPPTNGFALAALVLGLVGLVINPLLILSILAIIFGIVGLRRAPAFGRRGMAIAGIVLGVVSAVTGLLLTSLFFSGVSNSMKAASEDQSSAIASAIAAEPSQDTAPESDSTEASEDVSEEPAVPAEYVAALASAQSYADQMYMSQKGIYDQLTSEYGEQFPKDAAEYAIEHVQANWNDNALHQAQTYQEQMNMSRAAIHDQLTSSYGEQFTESQADYAIEHLDQ